MRYDGVILLAVSVGFLIVWNIYREFYSSLLLIIPAFLFLSISFCTVKRVFSDDTRMGVRFWGSFTFHIGLLTVIAVTSLGPITRFWATVVLPQGVMVNLEDEQFSTVHSIPVFGEIPFISLRLDWQESTYEDKRFAVDHAAGLTVGMIEGDSFKQSIETIRVNSPVRKGGHQLLLDRGKHSPLFVLKDLEGRVIFNRYVDVSNVTNQEDTFEIPSAGLTIYTRYFPDVFKEGDNYGTRSREPKNPAFGIRVESMKDPFRDTWGGVLKTREKAEFDGMTLEFADLKPVVILQVMKDPTYWGIFVGWALIVAGLTVRYLPFEWMGKWKKIRGIKWIAINNDGYQGRNS
jgi:cytochrome c biogenesis protein ResB